MWPWLLGFLVTATCWPGTEATASISRWAMLGVALHVGLCWVRIRLTWPLVALLAILLWSAMSVNWTPISDYGLNATWKWWLFAVAFMIGADLADLGPVLRGMAVGLIPSAVMATLQAGNGAGTFGNPDLMGEAAALVLVGLLVTEWRVWTCIAPVWCLVIAQARGALLAVAIALVAAFRIRRFVLVIAPIALLLMVGWPGSRDIFAANSMVERAQIWVNTIHGITWLGRGAGSYVTVYPQLAPPDAVIHGRPEHAHNDFLEFALEYGAVGILLGAAFVSLVLRRATLPVRLLLLAFGVEACFGFPLHNPATAFAFAVVAGFASRSWYCLCVSQLFGGGGLHDGIAGCIICQGLSVPDQRRP